MAKKNFKWLNADSSDITEITEIAVVYSAEKIGLRRLMLPFNDDTQQYPFLRLQFMGEKFGQSLNEPNNQISMNVPKV